ncbi:hypothetical protein McanCB21832_007499 [Microsporum canis]
MSSKYCQLGSSGISLALDLRPGMLWRGDDGCFDATVRSRSHGYLLPRFAATGRCAYCFWHGDEQDGSCHQVVVRSDARSEMGD